MIYTDKEYGELIPIDRMVLEFQKMLIAVWARLLALPVKLSPILININEPRDIEPVIKAEVYTALEELSGKQFAASIGEEVEKELLRQKQYD